jgi:hypothetical protein
MMSDESDHKPYEWADKMFSNEYDVEPKYRDMLAMLAAAMMGERGATEHFYNQAIVDGATDEQLKRVIQTAQSSLMDMGDPTTRVQESVEKLHAEERDPAAESSNAEPSPN